MDLLAKTGLSKSQGKFNLFGMRCQMAQSTMKNCLVVTKSWQPHFLARTLQHKKNIDRQILSNLVQP